MLGCSGCAGGARGARVRGCAGAGGARGARVLGVRGVLGCGGARVLEVRRVLGCWGARGAGVLGCAGCWGAGGAGCAGCGGARDGSVALRSAGCFIPTPSGDPWDPSEGRGVSVIGEKSWRQTPRLLAGFHLGPTRPNSKPTPAAYSRISPLFMDVKWHRPGPLLPRMRLRLVFPPVK